MMKSADNASSRPAPTAGPFTAATIAFGLSENLWISLIALIASGACDIVSVVIDRTFVDRDGVRWIVDFKTSTHEGAGLDAFLDSEQGRYRPQLERYWQLVRRLGSEPVRLGLYFPLLSGWREWGP